MILYTYAGYPLLLALLARTRRKPAPYPAVQPLVTLLIAAYNEEAEIARKLENSLELDYPHEKLQILVAADGSDDHTAEIVRGYADRGVELSYTLERGGKMAAINRAMPDARGEIVVFSDANNMYDPRAIRELIAPFADPKVGAVTGAKTIVQDEGGLSESEGLYWKYESFIKKLETRLGTCTAAAGEIFSLRRGLFVSPPSHIINDDFYMASDLIRRGFNVIYVPGARSYENVSASAQDEMVRRARIIAGRYQALALATRLLPWRRPLVAWQVVSHKYLRPLVPFAMIAALLANLAALIWPAEAVISRTLSPLLALAPPYNLVLLVLQILFYGLALIGSRVSMSGISGKLLYLPTFLVNSNLAALSGLYLYLTGEQTHLWQRVRRSGPQ
jgi:cellulose synthase/poly-beta-1,6-N-acetylglucosamine synthase-like glycosyltransferase